MRYPMIGKKYYVKFPTMSFYLSFKSETELEFIVERSPDLPPGSSHTVSIIIQPLRDGLYLVPWQEASGNTVVDAEDFNEHRVHAFLTMTGALSSGRMPHSWKRTRSLSKPAFPGWGDTADHVYDVAMLQLR
jgi:hypothetical protein